MKKARRLWTATNIGVPQIEETTSIAEVKIKSSKPKKAKARRKRR